MILIRPFRSVVTRSRSLRTDAQRIGSVSDAVTASLAGIAAEISGLKGRVELLGGRAGDLLSTEDGNTFEREHDDEVELQDAEREMLAGVRRLAELEQAKSLFLGLQQVIETHTAQQAGVALVTASSAHVDGVTFERPPVRVKGQAVRLRV